MAELWQIARGTRTCASTGGEIPPEVPYYSALVETDSGFERKDFSADAWPEVERSDFFSYWKNKGYPPKGAKRPPVDYERLLAFFDALEGTADGGKRLLRYVVALVLVRKRKLRLDDMGRTASGEDRLVLFDRRDGGRTVEITTPEAGREELEATQETLNRLFDCDFDETSRDVREAPADGAAEGDGDGGS